MTPLQRYYWLYYWLLKWRTTAAFIVLGTIVACILVDWIGHAGWGYPWYSLPLAAVMTAIVWAIRRAAILGLRRLLHLN